MRRALWSRTRACTQALRQARVRVAFRQVQAGRDASCVWFERPALAALGSFHCLASGPDSRPTADVAQPKEALWFSPVVGIGSTPPNPRNELQVETEIPASWGGRDLNSERLGLGRGRATSARLMGSPRGWISSKAAKRQHLLPACPGQRPSGLRRVGFSQLSRSSTAARRSGTRSLRRIAAMCVRTVTGSTKSLAAISAVVSPSRIIASTSCSRSVKSTG
jgi:hypothetical protein